MRFYAYAHSFFDCIPSGMNNDVCGVVWCGVSLCGVCACVGRSDFDPARRGVQGQTPGAVLQEAPAQDRYNAGMYVCTYIRTHGGRQDSPIPGIFAPPPSIVVFRSVLLLVRYVPAHPPLGKVNVNFSSLFRQGKLPISTAV